MEKENKQKEVRDGQQRHSAHMVHLPQYDSRIADEIIDSLFKEDEIRDETQTRNEMQTLAVASVAGPFWQAVAAIFYMRSNLPAELVQQISEEDMDKDQNESDKLTGYSPIDYNRDPFSRLEQIAGQQRTSLTGFSELIKEGLAAITGKYAEGKKAYYIHQATATKIGNAVNELHLSLADLSLYRAVIIELLINYRGELHEQIVDITLKEKIDPTVLAIEEITTNYFEALESMAAVQTMLAQPRINKLARSKAELVIERARVAVLREDKEALMAQLADASLEKAAETARADSYHDLTFKLFSTVTAAFGERETTTELDEPGMFAYLEERMNKLVSQRAVYVQLRECVARLGTEYDEIRTADDALSAEAIVAQTEVHIRHAARYKARLQELLKEFQPDVDYSTATQGELTTAIDELLRKIAAEMTDYREKDTRNRASLLELEEANKALTAQLAGATGARAAETVRADDYLGAAREILQLISTLTNGSGKFAELEAVVADDTEVFSKLSDLVTRVVEEQQVYKQLKALLTEIAATYDEIKTEGDALTTTGIVAQLKAQIEIAAYYRTQLREMLELHPNKDKKEEHAQQSGNALAESVGKLLSAAVAAAAGYQSLQKALISKLAITRDELRENDIDKRVLNRLDALLERAGQTRDEKQRYEALYQTTSRELAAYKELVAQSVAEVVDAVFSSKTVAGYLSVSLMSGGLCLSASVRGNTFVNAGYSATLEGKDAPGIGNCSAVNDGERSCVVLTDPISLSIGEFKVTMTPQTIAAFTTALATAVQEAYRKIVKEKIDSLNG